MPYGNLRIQQINDSTIQQINTTTLAQITGGALLQNNRPDLTIREPATDSRRILNAGHAAFFALRGPRHDGHRFLPEVYRRGVRCLVVDREVALAGYPEATVIRVEDTLAALQALAIYHRKQFELTVIGITGSNGKTIVKEWLFQLLHPDYRIVRSPRSYNSQVGVPLSVWQIGAQHELGIFEAGISQMGEMEKLAPIIDCDLGILTNIGEAHRAGFPSKREKLREKLRLFASARCLFYCRDHELLDEEVRALGQATCSWSFRRPADLTITEWEASEGLYTELRAQFRDQPVRLRIPFIDEASAENAIHCWLVLLYLGVEPQVIRRRMLQLERVAMRLELRAGIRQCTLINDSYNSDLTGLRIALDFLEQQRRQGRATLILSDLLQSGREGDALYREIGKLIKGRTLHRFIGVGREIPALRPYLPDSLEHLFFPDTDALMAALDELDFRSEVILLKGARRYAFERIAGQLSERVHRTVLEVNLSALSHNLRAYQRLLRPGARMMVMVKAAAYGSGSREVARLMEYQQVDYLAVAYIDEGIELRRAGLRLPIMVLNPDAAGFEQLLQYDLEPELYSLDILRQFAAFAERRGARTKVHLNLDTGMHRLGFPPGEWPALAALLPGMPQLYVQSIYTHLAASEDARQDALSRQQATQFMEGADQIAAGLNYRPWRHVLNSNGISRFPEFQMDMVRLGIGMYGIDSSGSVPEALQTVLSLKAKVAQIRETPAGEGVGYGRLDAAGHPRLIATVNVGYADGLPRLAGEGRYQLLIGKHLAPTVGAICMDMCMIDVTQLPGLRPGAEVEIFGAERPVEELARVARTIPYEIFTGIGSRVKRVYLQE